VVRSIPTRVLPPLPYLSGHVASRPVSLPKTNPALHIKDGGTLRTVIDALTYMLRLSKDREHGAMATRGRIVARIRDLNRDVR
jgi:hypothetical protein